MVRVSHRPPPNTPTRSVNRCVGAPSGDGTRQVLCANGPVAGPPCPKVVIGPAHWAAHDGAMQLIQPTHVLRPARGPLVLSTVVGSVLLVGGIALAWIAFATPLVRGLTPSVVRPALDQMALGAMVWGLSLVAPPCFAIVGAFRLFVVAAEVRRKPSDGVVARIASKLSDEHVIAPAINMPDGRVLRNLVVGPYGMAILAEPPPAKITRRQGNTWAVRKFDGRWYPLENPLERAVRDTERVRHWIAEQDTDFTVKVYAALVTADRTISRIGACAVVMPEDVPAWLASLPPQRSLNEIRRADLVELIRSIA
jgi:hypothetical protein